MSRCNSQMTRGASRWPDSTDCLRTIFLPARRKPYRHHRPSSVTPRRHRRDGAESTPLQAPRTWGRPRRSSATTHAPRSAPPPRWTFERVPRTQIRPPSPMRLGCLPLDMQLKAGKAEPRPDRSITCHSQASRGLRTMTMGAQRVDIGHGVELFAYIRDVCSS